MSQIPRDEEFSVSAILDKEVSHEIAGHAYGTYALGFTNPLSLPEAAAAIHRAILADRQEETDTFHIRTPWRLENDYDFKDGILTFKLFIRGVWVPTSEDT